ncbi:MAG: TonB-dependent receptor [Opitutales bacterium]|nr:TonB-dependent receptor [Opitutales bacterium]
MKRLSLFSLISVVSLPALAEELWDLDPFRVETTPEQESIVPTVRPIESVWMQGGNVLEMPRSVSTLTRGQLEARNIQRIEELSPYVAGAVSAPIFGNAGVPTLRGDLGEAYQNGQRKTFNRNVFPVSFNGVESVEVVRGAPPAVFGFGNATGGYLNFGMKQPHWTEWTSQLRATAGSWDSYRAQVDSGGQISEHWAARVSADWLDAGSFYRLVYNRSQSLYAALQYRANERVTLDLNAEYFRASYTENLGTTRPTQELIDSGWYITGSSVGEPGSALFGNTFEPTGRVRIDGSQVLLAPGDGARARVFNAQAILRVKGDEWNFSNRTYFEDVYAERYSSYYFVGYLPDSYTAENRSEWSRDLEWGGLRHEFLAGIAYRFEYRKSYVDILNQVFNPFDVTADPDTLRFPEDQLFFVQPVPGTPHLATPGGRYPREGMGPSVGLSATLNSTLHNVGSFAQNRIQFSEQWSLTLGGRLDHLWVDTKDPLPRSGHTAAEASHNDTLYSGSASLSYQPVDPLVAYMTLNRAAAVEGSGSSGGFGLNSNLDTGKLNFIAPELFRNSSELAEVGLKLSLLADTLFIASNLYTQKRNRLNPRFNLPDEIRVRGFESELVFQPNAQLSIGGNFSYSEANYINGPLPGSIQTVPYFDPSQPSGNFGAYEPGDYRLPGLPRTLFNVFGSYRLRNGLGTTLALEMQGEQNLDLFGHVVIPSLQQLNLTLFYQRDPIEIFLHINNLTNEFNWRPSATPFAGADLVTRELPRHWQFTMRYRF